MVYVLALHIVFMVCWFAGLFYIVRLFIYSTEANKKPEPDKSVLLNQFQIMKKRLLYGITWPAGILTVFFGGWLLLVYFPGDILQAWFILKLIFVAILVLYHLQCQIIFKQQSADIFKFKSITLRLFNEVATIVLIGVVFLVEVKSNTNWMYLIIGLVFLVMLIVVAVFMYKKQRIQQEGNNALPEDKKV
jgi:putative membrane protein